jgi:hypothetical protein
MIVKKILLLLVDIVVSSLVTKKTNEMQRTRSSVPNVHCGFMTPAEKQMDYWMMMSFFVGTVFELLLLGNMPHKSGCFIIFQRRLQLFAELLHAFCA